MQMVMNIHTNHQNDKFGRKFPKSLHLGALWANSSDPNPLTAHPFPSIRSILYDPNPLTAHPFPNATPAPYSTVRQATSFSYP